MSKNDGGRTEVVEFADIEPPPDLDVADHRAATQAAIGKYELSSGEALIVWPPEHPPPPGGWVPHGTLKSPKSGKIYNVFTKPAAVDPTKADQPGKGPANGNESAPGSEALKDIDSNFSADKSPSSSKLSCAKEFLKGFVEGAVAAAAIAFVVTLLLGPVIAGYIFLGMLVLALAEFLYYFKENIDAFKKLSPEEKAHVVGEFLGGFVGGAAGARGATALRGKLGIKWFEGGKAAPTTQRKRLPQDEKVNPNRPDPLPTNRPVGKSPTQNAAAQAEVARMQREGYTDIRVNQQQVDANENRVGTNRPDVQGTAPDGTREYHEFDTSSSDRGPGHRERILSNDPNGTVILHEVD